MRKTLFKGVALASISGFFWMGGKAFAVLGADEQAQLHFAPAALCEASRLSAPAMVLARGPHDEEGDWEGGPAENRERGHGHFEKREGDEHHERWSREHGGGRFFNERHYRFVHDYYTANNYANLPPGLKKYLSREGHLPPGLERQRELPPGLERPHGPGAWAPPFGGPPQAQSAPPAPEPYGGPAALNYPSLTPGQRVPPEIQPYMYPVDPYVYQQLGPLPENGKLYMYGRDLLLLNNSTQQIMDVLRNVY